MTDVLLVTAKSHPALFDAFERISHDQGRQAGHKNYAVPLAWEAKLPGIERALHRLLLTAPRDFETLCIGEQEEAQLIVARRGLQDADELLLRFSEEFS